jgi:hypothetical protein
MIFQKHTYDCPPEAGFHTRNQNNKQQQRQAHGEWLQIERLADGGLLLDTHGLNKSSDILRSRKQLSETGRYPLDSDWMGCNINGKTCPVVLVMVRRPERPNSYSCCRCSKVITSSSPAYIAIYSHGNTYMYIYIYIY